MDAQNEAEKHEQTGGIKVENGAYVHVHDISETTGAILLAIIAFFLILTLRRERKENQKLLRDLVRIIDKKGK